MSRRELDQTHNDCVTSNTNYANFESEDDPQVDDIFDLDKLLGDLGKIEDLDILDNIHNKLIAQRQCKIELNKKLEEEISEMRDALNKERCLVKQLDQVISSEQQKTEDLQNMIKIKSQEYSKLKADQILLLEEFESKAYIITEQIRSGPKCYAKDSLLEKLQQVHNEVQEVFPNLHKENERLFKAQECLKMPVYTPIENIQRAMKVFSDSLAEITSQNKILIKSMEDMTKRINEKQLNKKL